MTDQYKRLKYACYLTNISQAVVANITPLLFLTFRSMYGISYTLLGLLVLINFFTQLLIDLLFSFQADKFNIALTVKITPVITGCGMLVFALAPVLFPNSVFVGIVIGTVIFAMAGGLAEVLISPVIAEIPSENPQREMSKLHSVYAWGVVLVVVASTAFLYIFGREKWQWLLIIWLIFPVLSAVLFFKSKIPALEKPEKAKSAVSLFKNPVFMLCFFGIFLGGASECIMSQWSSSYIEQALQIPKVFGDVFGVAMFGVALGTGRSLYAKFGKNLYMVLCLGAMFTAGCYVVAAVSGAPVIGLLACAMTGFFVSMLWPGSLSAASENLPSAGVVLFALMAAGGDLGGAVGTQLVGIITDAAMKNSAVFSIADTLGMTAEQIGMKIGLLIACVFPLLACVSFGALWHIRKKKEKSGLPVQCAS